MDERERAASNRRLMIILGGGAALLLAILGALYVVGKGVGAPLESFDREGVGRFAGEGMKQIGRVGEKAAAKASTADEG
jgi:hypothetical protein